jgi:hypothetical protein
VHFIWLKTILTLSIQKTSIEFSVPNSSHIELKVYDITGKEIITLVDEKLNAGSYRVDFDGVYQTEYIFIRCRQIILLKQENDIS